MMLPHGPDMDAFEKATNSKLGPQKMENTMSFMLKQDFLSI